MIQKIIYFIIMMLQLIKGFKPIRMMPIRSFAKSAASSVAMEKSILVAVADGTEEIEAVTVIDTLVRGGGKVVVASVAGMQVTCSRGVKLTADCSISDCAGKSWDMIGNAN